MNKIYLCLFSLLLSLHSDAQIITTVAGCKAADTASDGLALHTMLHSPWAIAVDDNGNVYFSEPGNNMVRKVDAAGVISVFAGTGTAGYSGDGSMASAARLNTPYGLAADHHGNIYIADNMNNVVRRVNPAGIITTVVGNGSWAYSGDGGAASSAALNSPFDVATDIHGNLYISDAGNEAIRRVDTGGRIYTVVNGFSNTLPSGSCGYTGDLWLPYNTRLSGIAADTAGNVYIADYWDDVVRKVGAHGGMTSIAGNSPATWLGDGGPAVNATIYPKRVLADNAGNIFIADLDNNRIRMVDASGKINTIAGNGYDTYAGDGCAPTATAISSPVGIAMDAKGNLYIADQGDNRIRKVNIGTESVKQVEVTDDVRIMPVPNNGTFSLSGAWHTADDAISLQVFDAEGRVVYTGSVVSVNNKISTHISLNVTDGLYLLKLSSPEATKVLRVVVER